VEIESSKVRTKARRLVPLQEALKARLLPYRRDLGPINGYDDPQGRRKRIAAKEGIELKANGFRKNLGIARSWPRRRPAQRDPLPKWCASVTVPASPPTADKPSASPVRQ
jgi:hypothetical protein